MGLLLNNTNCTVNAHHTNIYTNTVQCSQNTVHYTVHTNKVHYKQSHIQTLYSVHTNIQAFYLSPSASFSALTAARRVTIPVEGESNPTLIKTQSLIMK